MSFELMSRQAHGAPPLLMDQAYSTVAFMLTGPSTMSVVYEMKRDYLSAPRSYIRLNVTFSNGPKVSTGGEYLSDDDWVELNDLNFGVYTVSSSSLCEDDGEIHWVIYSSALTLEFIAICVDLGETIYHQPNAFAALHHSSSKDYL